MRPPKPPARADRVSLLAHFRAFRKDILSAQPNRLYRAWMAEYRTPFFRSFLINQPDLVREVLQHRPLDFPKSGRIAEGLRPLLGNSVFLTNGADWERQRRIIDPAFEGGRIKTVFPSILAAGQSAASRVPSGAASVEELTSHAAADVIFRTLFSVPIEDHLAAQVYDQFRAYQRSQPILNLGAFVPLPRWIPRGHRRAARRAAQEIRALIAQMVDARLAALRQDDAPDDLATALLTARDPDTGESMGRDEMIDQVAIFFLAGHETSASALAWALYLLANAPEDQARVAKEARAFAADPQFANLKALAFTRDVFREALRLYPPVPMMVRQTSQPERFRDRDVPKGAQIVISPWHMHRHERFWDAPDDYCPARWQTPEGKASAKEAYLPFSAGRRVCPGAGFAMVEGPVLLASYLARFEISADPQKVPVPVAHLTVRSESGIYLSFTPREGG